LVLVFAVEEIFRTDTDGLLERMVAHIPSVAEAEVDDGVARGVDVAANVGRSGVRKGNAGVDISGSPKSL
jgi:hypothetical protein